MKGFNLPLMCAASATLALSSTVAEARPRAAEPPAASAVCDRYGPGYRLLSGTETCVKISGNVRAEFGVVSGGSGQVGAYLDRPRR